MSCVDLQNLQDAYTANPADILTHLALADRYAELGDDSRSWAHRWVGENRPRLFYGDSANREYKVQWYGNFTYHWYRETVIPRHALPGMIWDRIDFLMMTDPNYSKCIKYRSVRYAPFRTMLRAYNALIEALRLIHDEFHPDLPRGLQAIPCAR